MRLKLDNNFKFFSPSNKLILSPIIDFHEFTFSTKLVIYLIFYWTYHILKYDGTLDGFY